MDQKIKQAAFLAKLLDSRFKIGKFSFGIDPILGLIPGVGDLITLGLSLYIVNLGSQMGLPGYKIAQMLGNVFIDFLFGAIPVLGDIFDIGFKGNLRNLKILEKASSILHSNNHRYSLDNRLLG